MHRSRGTNLSEESFIALMDALGFVDVENHQLEEVHSLNTYPIGFTIAKANSMTHGNDISHLPREPETPFDEAVLFKREFLADYDFSSDLDGDSGDYEYSKLNDAWVLYTYSNHLISLDDTLPSRPCSATEGFDTVDPSTKFPSPSRQSRLLPARARPMTRPRAPSPPARPLALYLPDGVPFPALGEIYSPTPSTFSSVSSSCYSRSGESTISNDLDSLRSTPDSTVYLEEGTVYIKAAFNATIIMLRASRWISFADLKQRLYDKFVKQEGILLSPSFSVISVRPPSMSLTDTAAISPWSTSGFPFSTTGRRGLSRSRSGSAVPNSLSSMKRMSAEPRRISFAERTEMHFIDDETDWKRVLAIHRTDGSKVTLRIVDTST